MTQGHQKTLDLTTQFGVLAACLRQVAGAVGRRFELQRLAEYGSGGVDRLAHGLTPPLAPSLLHATSGRACCQKKMKEPGGSARRSISLAAFKVPIEPGTGESPGAVSGPVGETQRLGRLLGRQA